MPLIKLIGADNLQPPVTARIFLPKSHRDTILGCALTNAITFTANGKDHLVPCDQVFPSVTFTFNLSYIYTQITEVSDQLHL